MNFDRPFDAPLQPPNRAAGLRPRLLAALGLLVFVLAAAPGRAEPPEVVRARVPSKKVANWFPADTPLRLLAPEEFEALLKSAAERTRERAEGGPRLIRARHAARFSAGLIRGRSELVVAGASGEGSTLSLEPWSPAILTAAKPGATVGASAAGEAVLLLDSPAESPGERTVQLEWELRARPDSRGRRFALDLPGDATSTLILDAPRGWEPSGPPGRRLGPFPGTDADRETWRFHGRMGRLDLRLVNLAEKGESENPPHVWVNGPTRIDLDSDADSTPNPANWTTEWTIQADDAELREFSVTLDPGLELLDVDGPNVQAFRLDPDPSARRVTVVLAGSARVPSVVRFQARAGVPAEGTWSAPAIRPERPAVWTGGTTTIILDENLVVRECRERDGRRIPSPSSDPTAAAELVFEAVAPGSVAELTFVGPGSRASHVTRGRLFATASSIRLECELTGLGRRGSATEHDVEIPPNWVLDGVRIDGIEEGVSWNQSVREDGSGLLRVLVPPSDDSPGGKTLSLSASSTLDPGQGPLALPRVRLSKGTIADEVWTALADDQIRLQPISTSGLAWIDPAEVPGLLPSDPPAGLKPVLGWRWTAAEAAEAVVDRQLVEAERQGWIHVKARIEERGRRLALEGRITIAAGRDELAAPPVWIDLPAKNLGAWRFVDAETGAEIEPALLTDPARRKLALPRSGAAFELMRKPSAEDRAVIDFRAKLAWNGQGRIPLPCLPKSFSPRGVVVIETPHRMRSRIAIEGLRKIEPALAGRLASGPETRAPSSLATLTGSSSPYWTAHALTYSDLGCRLDLTTEELAPSEVPGMIREARLTTRVFSDGHSLNRLRMLVAVDPLASLRLKAPTGLDLVRLRIDGRDVEPIADGDRVALPPQRDQGDRDRLIEMDYRVGVDPATDLRDVRPVVPDFGLPCLSFDWELILPDGRGFDRPSPEFVVNAAPPRASWPFGALDFPILRWPGQRASVRPPRVETIRQLDAQLEGLGHDGLSFAEWFTRWDSGDYPVVVDRTALSDAGFGPRSRCEPAQREPGGLAASTRTLHQYGLVPLIIEDALVITTRDEAASLAQATSWRSEISEALFWGGDKTDRFQSAARWRGEASLDEVSAGGEPGQRRLPGFRSWRLSSASWPGPDAMARTTNASARTLLGWLVLASVVFLAGSIRGVSPRRDLIGPPLLMALAVAARTWAPVLPESVFAGVFVGAFAILLARLGGLLRSTLSGDRDGAGPRGPSTTFRRRLGPRLTALGIAAAILIPSAVRAVDEGEKPIIALIPYDEPFDPALPPRRIILREEDHRRLQEFAHPRDGSTNPGPTVLEAQHRVARSASREIVVTSDYTLKTGREPSTFVFPVSGAWEIQATIDDEAVPVAIAPGGESGVVALAADRTSRLQVRREAAPTRDGPTEIFSLQVNPTPRAKLTLEQPPEVHPVQWLDARGAVVAKGNQTIEAELGPMDRIEISWTASEPVVDQLGATVESLILWDLDSAGERVRARLTYHPRRRISTIRIALDPGLTPRAVQVPGLVDSTWGGTPQNPEWIARVDPPIQDRTTIELDFWRPLHGGSVESAESDTSPGGLRLRFPRVEPLGVDLGPGLLAVRRPGHWTGRLESPPNAEPVGDESFVRAWGPLPQEPLTFAGTVRFNHRDAVEFSTGPAPTRWKLKPTARVRIDSGRIDCRIEAELSEISGLLDHVELELPDDLIVVGVESEDLTDWSRPPGKPLQVRFDRIDLKSRRFLEIQGWIPVSQARATSSPGRLRARLPWIGVAAPAVVQPGTLVVESKGDVELASAEGGAVALAIEDVERGGDEAAPGWFRRAYRIDDPAKVGELRWAPFPPRVNVQIASRLTIHPDSAEWVAVLRYDVIGGELDAIHLKVPAAWAAGARLQLTGQDHQLTTESRDQSTFWSMTPERPIWGSQRMVLRSSLPLTSEQEIDFPELAPLGQGIVDCSLGIVFATASLPTTEGSAGLRPIAYASRFQDAAFGGATGMATRAFRVERDGWSLKIQAPPHGDAASTSGAQTASVENADLSYVVMADGSILGRATYQIKPHSGQFLAVEPSDGGELTRATVDGLTVTPLLAEGGRWTIPLGEPSGALVNLVWTEKPPAADPAAVTAVPRSLSPPRAGEERTPSLVTVYLPPNAVIRPSPGDLEAVGPERLDLERAGRIARRITELLSEMDRGSGRDRQRLTSLLIEHELALRTAERALEALVRSPDRARRDRASRELEVVRTSRDAMDEAVRSAGLDERLEAARVYLGLVERSEDSQAPGVPEPTNIDRIRGIGQPTFLIGSTPGLQSPPARVDIHLERSPGRTEDAEDRARSRLLLAFLLGLALASLGAARLARTQAVMIAAGLALASIAGGPSALAAGAAAALFGWYSKLGSSSRPGEAAA